MNIWQMWVLFSISFWPLLKSSDWSTKFLCSCFGKCPICIAVSLIWVISATHTIVSLCYLCYVLISASVWNFNKNNFLNVRLKCVRVRINYANESGKFIFSPIHFRVDCRLQFKQSLVYFNFYACEIIMWRILIFLRIASM